MNDLGELRYFLGIEVARSCKGLVLNQRKYAMDLISEVGLLGSKPVKTPMDCNSKITSDDYDKLFDLNRDDELIVDIVCY